MRSTSTTLIAFIAFAHQLALQIESIAFELDDGMGVVCALFLFVAALGLVLGLGVSFSLLTRLIGLSAIVGWFE